MLCKHSFNRYISRSANAGRKLATLGPSRTSSYAAARHFAQDYPADIALFPTYEEAADAVRAAPGESALIVANAYANINRFYISDVLHPIGAFFKDTRPTSSRRAMTPLSTAERSRLPATPRRST